MYLTGSGGWTGHTGSDSPVFMYVMELTDGGIHTAIPLQIDTSQINADTTSSRTLQLSKRQFLGLQLAKKICLLINFFSYSNYYGIFYVFLLLGGELLLPEAAFLAHCGSGNTLTLFLDTENSLMESNELNNMATIPDVTISDGGLNTCICKLLDF